MKDKVLAENKSHLCPNCKTGKESYLLDKRSPFCPYIFCHKDASCSMFVLLLEKRLEGKI